jgi:hypothetical protein
MRKQIANKVANVSSTRGGFGRGSAGGPRSEKNNHGVWTAKNWQTTLVPTSGSNSQDLLSFGANAKRHWRSRPDKQ